MVVHRFGSVLGLAAVAALCTACSGAPTAPTGQPRTSATPVPGSLAGVTIESFSVLEYGQPGSWNYAPLMRIAAGPAAVIVTRVRFTIPGVDTGPDICGAFRIEPGTSRDLFREVFGEYEVLFSGAERSTGGTATAVIEIRNDAAEQKALSVDGSVASGSPTDTYGAVLGSWNSCS